MADSREDFSKRVSKTFELAVKLKKVMLKKKLTRARAKCPDCPGKFLHGTINGTKQHIHMVCDCRKYIMME